MTKHQTADNVLLELWAIKEDTVARHKTVAQYFAHLGFVPSARGAQSVSPTAVTRRVRKNVKPKMLAKGETTVSRRSQPLHPA